ncbi:MAG: sodium:proton exchanger [Lentisphaerae bacterium]|nr:sodium:proton exchanger [Lentisphaerota bacterium]
MKSRLAFAALFVAASGVAAGAAWAGSGEGGAAHAEVSMTHRMMVLVLQLGVILFVAKFSARLFEKIGMPGVLGEIAGGVAIGPYLLGGAALPSLPEGLFPLAGAFPVSPELYGFCAVAAVVLLFNAGLETDVPLFLRYSLAGSMVGLGGVLASFVLGDLVAVWCSRLLSPAPIGFLAPPALFLGVMSTATSVGITARILSERGKVDSPEGVTILAGAVIDDVLGIIMLAVAMGMISASRTTGSVDWAHIGIISAKAVGIWLAATTVGLVASPRISLLLKLFRDRRTIAIMSLGIALILAGLFEEAGLAMIIGAYVTGLSMSRTDLCHLIREKLEPVVALFVPVFFVVMGMLVNIRLLASPRVLAFGGIYTVVAVAAKLGGCAAPALACGFNLRGALRVGAGMIPRGEVALIVAGIGLAAGIVGQDVFGVGVLMTLVTTLIAPPALIGLLRGGAPGVRRPAPAGQEQAARFTLPSVDAVEVLTDKIMEVFEDDGFFVHTLDRDAGIYQMRKDVSVVTLRKDGLDVVFECSGRDMAFVRAAVTEVVSELQRMAAELAKPVDRASLAGEPSREGGGGPAEAGAALEGHIVLPALAPRLKGGTKEEIIAELVDLAARTGVVRDAAPALAAVLAREKTGSTGMQHGIALPHGKTDAVDRIVCAVGLKKHGVDFDSLDGEPSRIFVLVLSPKDVSGPHVRFLATISRVLDEEGRAALLGCNTPAEMRAALTHGEKRKPSARG